MNIWFLDKDTGNVEVKIWIYSLSFQRLSSAISKSGAQKT